MKTTIKLIALCLLIGIFQSCNESTETTQQEKQQESEQIEQEIAEQQEAKNPYLVTKTSFYGFKLGEAVGDRAEKTEMETGEGIFEIYTIKDENGEELGYIHPDFENENNVGTIVVTTEKAISEHDVKIGMLYTDFDAKFPDAELHGSEIEGNTHATHDDILYHLSDRHWEYDLDKSKIDKAATIDNITIQ